MARQLLEEKRKKAIDLVTRRYSEEKSAHGGKLPVRSFVKIRDDTLEELSLHDENILATKQFFLVSNGSPYLLLAEASDLQWKK
jgi:hypothetical protein